MTGTALDPLAERIKHLVRLSHHTRHARRKLKAPTGRPPEDVGRVRLAEIADEHGAPLVEVRFPLDGKRKHHRTNNWDHARDLARKIDAVLPAPASHDVITGAPAPSGDELLVEMLGVLRTLCAELRGLREEIWEIRRQGK